MANYIDRLSGRNLHPTRQSQRNPSATPPDTEKGKKAKGNRNSIILISTKKWKPIATQRTKKPPTSVFTQGKPALDTCEGKITIINPVVASKDKFTKEVDQKLVRDAVKGKSQKEEESDLFRTRRSGLRNYGVWKGTQANNSHPAIYLPIKQEHQKRGLEGYGLISSSEMNTQGPVPMENGKQEFQPSITLGRTCSKVPEDMPQKDTLQGPHGNNQRVESQQEVRIPEEREFRIRKNQATIQAIEEK
ncbi:hypothetical protein O181_002443 [Austropuccinia psidii MF-1]|uniref:Uncharacterized protein n=1 Tax=Austropuccinia psidii MF-1 TaxID=1389203 RepID=A0A9Q3GCM7_9BASI|nr:hypothetical protein [Austropuccinia psidii MF-1]